MKNQWLHEEITLIRLSCDLDRQIDTVGEDRWVESTEEEEEWRQQLIKVSDILSEAAFQIRKINEGNGKNKT